MSLSDAIDKLALDLAEARAERDLYRAALRCERCRGMGSYQTIDARGYWVHATCPDCREAREKARNNG